MKSRILFLFLLMMLSFAVQGQLKKMNREIILMTKKDSAGCVLRYNYISKGAYLICFFNKGQNKETKLDSIHGKLNFIASDYIIIDTSKIQFKQICSLSTWTASNAIMKISGGPIVVLGLTIGAVSTGIIAIPVMAGLITTGIIFLCRRTHYYDCEKWTPDNALYGDYLNLRIKFSIR